MPRKPSSHTVQILPFTGKKPKRPHPSKNPAPVNPPKPKQPPRDASGDPADRNAGDGDNQRAMLYATLGSRFRIDGTLGYMLDGRPTSYPEVMRIAKQVRKKHGLPLDAKYWEHF